MLSIRKILIYIILSIIVLSLIIPTFSLAFNQDSVYVWSDFASSVSTSISPSEEEQQENR